MCSALGAPKGQVIIDYFWRRAVMNKALPRGHCTMEMFYGGPQKYPYFSLNRHLYQALPFFIKWIMS